MRESNGKLGQYQWLTYHQLYSKSCDFGSGLKQILSSKNMHFMLTYYSAFREICRNMYGQLCRVLYCRYWVLSDGSVYCTDSLHSSKSTNSTYSERSTNC